MTLTEDEFNEIKNMITTVMEGMWMNLESRHKVALDGVQIRIEDIKVQASLIQESAAQVRLPVTSA